MDRKTGLINTPGLWGGLHRPDRVLDDTDIALFGIPYDGGVSFRAGAGEGPDRLREITYTLPPTSETFEDLSSLRLCDLGDIFHEQRDTMFLLVEEKVAELVRRGIFFSMIGGDHSTTIPVVRGVTKGAEGSLGIIHLDAHFDLCQEMKGDVYSHGSAERRALELPAIGSLENIFFIGVRSIETQEWSFIRNKKTHTLSARDCANLGIGEVISRVHKKMARFDSIYMTLDIDVLDPAFAPGTGTPQAGGLSSRELLMLLEGLFKLPIIGMDLVEIAPALDPAKITLFAARKILTECWAHQYRKMKKPVS